MPSPPERPLALVIACTCLAMCMEVIRGQCLIKLEHGIQRTFNRHALIACFPPQGEASSCLEWPASTHPVLRRLGAACTSEDPGKRPSAHAVSKVSS